MAKQNTKKYPVEFKQSSARLAAESNQPISQTAKDLGIKKTTLYGWVNKYHPNDNSGKEDKTSLNHELQRLRKENIKLKQERDILKKAAAYFAGEM